jgi:hypothetical protein
MSEIRTFSSGQDSAGTSCLRLPIVEASEYPPVCLFICLSSWQNENDIVQVVVSGILSSRTVIAANFSQTCEGQQGRLQSQGVPHEESCTLAQNH